MKRTEEDMARGPGAAMARPMLWSAAAHLVVVSACLLAGTGRGPADGVLPVIEIHLVGGERESGPPESSGPPPAPLRRDAGPPTAPRGKEVPLPRHEGPPAAADVRMPRGPERPERPTATAPALLEPAIVEGRTADPAAGPAPASATGAGSGIEAGPAVSGPAAGAGPVVAGPAPGGAPRVTAIAPGGTGEAGGRSRPDGEIGLLRERIQSRIVYPGEAIRRGLEGEVLLRIHIATGGMPNEIRVARSSGARVLDDAARRGVVRAAPLPSSPGWVEIPVRFRLR